MSTLLARAPGVSAVRRAARANQLITAGTLIVAVIVVVAVFAPLLAPYPADAGTATHPEIALQAPSLRHLFGTDQVGRDVFSRVLYGARVSPVIAFFVLLIACAIGVPLGVVAGYFGGVDRRDHHARSPTSSSRSLRCCCRSPSWPS